MNLTLLKNVLSTNLVLKVCSLFLGYHFWLLWNIHNYHTLTVTVPLYFYNNEHNNLVAPEEVSVTVQATRSDLYKLDLTTLAAHIDAYTLHEQENMVLISGQNLFLPSHYNVIDCNPSPVHIVKKTIEHVQDLA